MSAATQRQLDWYFDFISPFSYLQSELLGSLPSDVKIHFKPVLFAGLLNHWDNIGPAEVAPKRSWTFEHCAWLAHKHGTAMTMPPHHPFNPLPLLRLCVALGSTPQIVQRLFRYVWREGKLPEQGEHWQALLSELGATPETLAAPAVKDSLRRNGDDAIAAGVFGVPTSVIDGRRFWGVDATDMLLAYLRGDPFFQSPQLAAARALPHGVQRTRAKPSP
jgi:2-hydroxychromene-2-carboxylate isomerase